MGQIGHFGNVKFYVKRDKSKPKMLSYNNLKWDTSINIEEHRRQGKKPLLEVTGRNADEISMDVYIDARFGVKPWKILSRLRAYNLEGRVYPLGLGGRRVGKFKWIITRISNNVKVYYHDGKIVALTASVSFKEYPYRKTKAKKKKVYKKSKKGKEGSNSSNSKKAKRAGGYEVYEVKKGDTLWALAKKKYNAPEKYMKIFNANRNPEKGFNVIKNPSKIYPGWKIKIPN